jgi:hypothetical protein
MEATWQHKVIHITANEGGRPTPLTPEEIAEACTRWSSLGWELVACEPYPDRTLLMRVTLVFEKRVFSNNGTKALTSALRAQPTASAMLSMRGDVIGEPKHLSLENPR